MTEKEDRDLEGLSRALHTALGQRDMARTLGSDALLRLNLAQEKLVRVRNRTQTLYTQLPSLNAVVEDLLNHVGDADRIRESVENIQEGLERFRQLTWHENIEAELDRMDAVVNGD